MKKIALLGITGSIGQSTVAVCREQKDRFSISIAAVYSNYKKLFEFAEEFKIKTLVIIDERIKEKINDFPKNVELFFGEESLQRIIKEYDYDILLNAVSGSPGLIYTVSALERNIDVALANKESLVMAGEIIQNILRKKTAKLLPVDSEHSAILQSLGTNENNCVKKIIITASGGPFRKLSLNNFINISLKDALNHPTWSMGNKITIDSATMMNKGLEVIEAHWLFDLEYDKIDSVIHPQSIIHSLVEFVDGSIVAQMGNPSMTLPILYALTYPERIKSNINKTDLLSINSLTFEKIDFNRYPLFKLALEVGREGGILPTVMNATNEAAVHLFLKEKISYLQMMNIIGLYVEKFKNFFNPTLEDIINVNKECYQKLYKNYIK